MSRRAWAYGLLAAAGIYTVITLALCGGTR